MDVRPSTWRKKNQPKRREYERPEWPCTECARTDPAAGMIATGSSRFSAEQIKELVAALEVPFDPSQIEWRVMNTTKSQQPHVAR